MVTNLIGAFLVSLIISFLLMPIIIGILKKRNLIETRSRRKIHKNNVPSLGGIGIIAGFAIALIIWLTFTGIIAYKYVLAGTGLLFFAGIRDDLIPISPRVKLMVQILAATIVLLSGVMIDSTYGLFGVEELGITQKVFFTIGFIIFFTNSFNLIDGLDGLAGTVALIISIFFTVWFYLNGSYYLAIISMAMTGAVIGFLYYNWQPAKIFMGDTGALSLGFLFSVLCIFFLNQNNILTSEWHKFNAPIAVVVSVLLIPLFDTIRIIVVRLIKRKSPFKPDKNHTHHVLMRLGLSHRMTAILLGLINIVFIILVSLFNDLGDNILLPIIISICFLLSVLIDQLIINRVRTKRRRV